MRRKDKEITDRSRIDAVIHDAAYCVLSLSDGTRPYGVPLCFGYQDGVIYLHSAAAGRKIRWLEQNPLVSLAFVIDDGPVTGEKSCKWGFSYRSAIVEGTAERIEAPGEKQAALAAIMAHYNGPRQGFSEAEIARTAVIRVKISAISGKQSPPAADGSARNDASDIGGLP